jgi:hypothetical protein
MLAVFAATCLLLVEVVKRRLMRHLVSEAHAAPRT